MNQQIDGCQTPDGPDSIQASGYCNQCRTVHSLSMGDAKAAALELINTLDREKRLDYHLPEGNADPRLTTDYLFGKARGKMFGVMICQQGDGRVVTIKSFSGQYNGQWQIRGWAPPLFDLKEWCRVNDETELEIKKMGAEINAAGKSTAQGIDLVNKRKKRSRELMKALHNVYALNNFRGQCSPLSHSYTGSNGIPNGTADCCGPKLLNFAAVNDLLPLGLAEFYYGKENKKGDRIHGQFYPSCRDKCAPIMGYLLCGLGESVKC